MTTDMTTALAELRVARNALDHAIQSTEEAAQVAPDPGHSTTTTTERPLLILELRMRSPEP